MDKRVKGDWLDITGLGVAGLVNTILTPLDQALLLAPGTAASGSSLAVRSEWIAGQQFQWQAGWLFYFVVTLSFAWSFYALGRNLAGRRQWKGLAVGLAVIAAAVDMVGFILNIAALPALASSYQSAAAPDKASLFALVGTVDALAYAFTYVAAFGLYSVAGLLLLPPLFSTPAYPRWLAWVGAAEWIASALTTVLLIASPALPSGPILVCIALYAPWIWGSMWWVWHEGKKV